MTYHHSSPEEEKASNKRASIHGILTDSNIMAPKSITRKMANARLNQEEKPILKASAKATTLPRRLII